MTRPHQQQHSCSRPPYPAPQLFKQWRDSCDPLRQKDSKAVVMEVAAFRSTQLAEKVAAKDQAKHADDYWHTLNEQARVFLACFAFFLLYPPPRSARRRRIAISL